MNRTIKIFLIILFSKRMFCQVPFTASPTGNQSSGLTAIITDTEIWASTIPWSVSNTAEVTHVSGTCVKLLPGFSASGFSGNGFYNAKIKNPAPPFTVVNMGSGPVNLANQNYRLELGFTLPNPYSQLISNFLDSDPLNNNGSVNPYDPDQIKLTCVFKDLSTNETYTRYGFYYKDYQTSNNQWYENQTNYSFRVRFAPPKASNYEFTSYYSFGSSNTTVFTATFQSLPTSDKGLLQMAAGNLRKMQYSDGTLFFAVGQNIAYAAMDYTVNQSVKYPEAVASHNTYEIQRGYINNLASNSGNFVRIRLDDWSNPIETMDKQIFLCDEPSKPLINCLNNYNNNQKHMWEFDKTLDLCENNGLYIMLNILNDQQISTTNAYGLETWSFSPYSALLGNDLAGSKAFFTDPNAKAIFKKRLFYIMARWGYSSKIAIWELINETDHINDYQTNPSFETNVLSWLNEMKSYMESTSSPNFYPWHPFTTGFTSWNVNTDPSFLNIRSQNQYDNSFRSGNYHELNLKDRFGMAAWYYHNYKPFIFGELGTFVHNCGDADSYDDKEFHNAIWSTSMMGGIGCGLYYWDWEQKNGTNHRSNFNALKTFFYNRVDLTKINDIEKHEDGSNYTKVYNFYMSDKSNNIEYAAGWARNGMHAWPYSPWPSNFYAINFTGTCAATPVSSPYLSYDIGSSGGEPGIVFSGKAKYSARYKIDYYDTYSDNHYIASETKFSSGNNLTFKRLMTIAKVDPFYPDYAYILNYDPWFPRGSETDTVDTNEIDTICFDGEQFEKGIDFDFEWRVDKVHFSNKKYACFPMPKSGTHGVNLKIKNKKTGVETLIKKQLVVTNRFETTNQIKVFPNPAANDLSVEVDVEHANFIICNMLGQQVLSIGIKKGINHIDLSNLFAGAYIFKVEFDNEVLKCDKLLISK